MKKYGHAIFLGVLALGVVAIWYIVLYVEAHRVFRVTFFDVGQGDAIFVEVPNGNQILIDGGPSDRVAAKLGEHMPFWDRSIDLLILTHPHTDHLNGLLEVLKRYDVGMVMEAGVRYSTPEYGEWRDLLKKKNVQVMVAQRGQRVHISPSADFDILAPFENSENTSPKNVHDAMVVSKLRYSSTTVLFTGDAEETLEYKLLMSGADLAADILKVGNHGSKTSTANAFVRMAAPKIAVISAGKNNRYGHPHQQTLDTLEKFGVKIFRTDRDGDIEFTSDGNSFVSEF